MNKKADTIMMIKVLTGIAVAILCVFFIFLPLADKIFGGIFKEEIKQETRGAFDGIVISVNEDKKEQIVDIQNNFGVVVFNKGEEFGIGGFKRPEECFDIAKGCLCLCRMGGIDTCSKEKNKEKTICKEINYKVELENFDDYINSGIYAIKINRTDDNVKLIKQK